MNERILKLLAQTDIPQFPILGSLAWVATDHDMEKFAQLIVKECADKCLEMAYVNPGPQHYAAMLKEHFGVES